MKQSVKRPVVNGKRSICEVHREIYDALTDADVSKEHFDKLVDLLEEAFGLGKKMDAKLRQYKFNYPDDWWEKNKNASISFDRRKGKKAKDAKEYKGKRKKK